MKMGDSQLIDIPRFLPFKSNKIISLCLNRAISVNHKELYIKIGDPALFQEFNIIFELIYKILNLFLII